MRIFKNINTYQQTQQPLWVTIGTFDGMHLGHQYLIEQMLEYSQKVHEHPRTMIITFDIHPQTYFAANSPRPIMTNRHKIQYIEKTGIDDCLMMNFDEKLSKISAEQFIEEYLVKKLQISGIVIGFNNTFGYQGRGNIKLLKRYAMKNNFTALTAKPFYIEDSPVSSSRIREILKTGMLAGAKKLLGRYFSVLGIVIKGVQRGRKLGIPTANIKMDISFLPPLGVYGVKVLGIDEKQYFGVANIGYNPTFHINNPDSMKPQLEVIVFDFNSNLYGKELTIEFITRIRDEIKFDSLDKLISGIQSDIEKFRIYTSKNLADC